MKRLDTTIHFNNLIPHKTHRFLLTVTNPLFDPISVSLLTPRHTPGTEYPSRVTILCPEFEVGANTDVWDEALLSTKPAAPSTPKPAGVDARLETVYEQKRNFTSVVIEIVPPEIPDSRENRIRDERLLEIPIYVRVTFEAEVDRDDDDTAAALSRAASSANAPQKEKVEYSYWCVVGIGRIGDPVEGIVASEPNTPVRTPVGTPVKAPRTPAARTPLRAVIRP